MLCKIKLNWNKQVFRGFERYSYETLMLTNRYFSVSSNRNKLVIEPQNCLHDEVVNISACDLKPKEKVTITSSIFDTRGQTFLAYAHYIANDSGLIDLQIDKSIGGSFTGVFPMGLIACLRPAPNEHKYLRFFKKEVEKPLMVEFKLIRGHLGNNIEYNSEDVMDSVSHERFYMAPGVKRISVKEGNIRGALFIPPGDGPFPGVIDLFGTAGGLIEYRGAQLASRGFVCLALAYFQYDDLPEDLEYLKMSYFEEGAKYLINHAKVKKDAIGAIGVSKGGDLVCSMATFIPEVKAAVCINGLPINTWCKLETKDKTYPGLNFNLSRGKILSPELLSTMDMMDNSDEFPETHIPLHEADAQFLFLVSLEDKNWKTELENEKAINRLKAKGKENYKIIKYKGAGHLLEPPYSPFCEASYHKMAGAALLWGGNPVHHNNAQVQAWQDIINFLKKNLS